MEVFLLTHVHHAGNLDGSVDHVDEAGELVWDEQDGDDLKTLGVYSTEQRALDRIEQAKSLRGFGDEPECFLITAYRLDEDHWTEGFVTVPAAD
jgi:hypothetical protein